MNAKRIAIALVGVVVLSLLGCKENEPMKVSDQPVSDQAKAPTINIADATEVDLVEKMADSRAAYKAYLEALIEYYTEKGMYDKRKWAEKEYDGLQKVDQYVYLMVADLPEPGVTRPTNKIADADQLYRDALEYYKHLPLPGMYSPERMRIALEKFKTIIKQYPQSDKVDDSYFYAAEILKEYFNENLQAVEYYERSYMSDPRTPHPARFQRAVILDFRMHQRDEALQMYREVLKWEADRGTFWSKSNADFSASRIKQLTGESR